MKKQLRCLSAQEHDLEKSNHVEIDSRKEKISKKVLTKKEKPKLAFVE
jgi:hypothetical protein